MALFTKESLETLRQRINIVDVISSYVELKRMGSVYKALCPFHDEKTPSFVVQSSDSHYHCYGCGAHGDAIQFLMEYQRMSFFDAVENLAQRFNVVMDYVEGGDEGKGISKKILKEALEQACCFYQCMLLHTEEGHKALHYLYARGVDDDFIKRFQLGLAPQRNGLLQQVLRAKGFDDEVLSEAGLLTPGRSGRLRDFFSTRITFPIRDVMGSVVGFSARKYTEDTYGGKYINTSETSLFKKSTTLFGLNYCRRRIAKERKAIIVEGQVDALRLIQHGFGVTVAALGTAFGEGHVKQLVDLGVNMIYLAMDGDDAGRDAACKVGDFFQRQGIEVYVLPMPVGKDPDSIIMEYGPTKFDELISKSIDYLTFLVGYFSRKIDVTTPAGKQELVHTITQRIREWENAVMIHESLRKLAKLIQVPEHLVGVGKEYVPQILVRKTSTAGSISIDPDRILESDLLRWLLMMGKDSGRFIEIACSHLKDEDFRVPVCRWVYHACREAYKEEQQIDLLSLAASGENEDVQNFLEDISQKKVNKDRAEQHFVETIQSILNRNWMEECERIKTDIQSGRLSETDALELLKQFNQLKKNPPKVELATS